MIIRHWRQDWEYEHAKLLVYSDRNAWTWEDVLERMRTRRWSKTVYQVDDSPRYARWGQFETQGGARLWRSGTGGGPKEPPPILHYAFARAPSTLHNPAPRVAMNRKMKQ